MQTLTANLYNARQPRDTPKLKRWRYAGLMLTYRCTAACRFCYYYCKPQAEGLMPTDMAIQAWAALRRLAGQTAKVHLTGGEPFLVFERLLDICRQAQRLGLGGADYVETNAGWVDDSTEARHRLQALDETGLKQLRISWDIFHAEFVPAEKVRLLVRLAEEELGPDRVLIRWRQELDRLDNVAAMEPAERRTAMKTAMVQEGGRFTGRAAEMLGPLCAEEPLEKVIGKDCKHAVLGAKGVHIDPYGNVFNGQCSGMAVGNIRTTVLDELWRGFDPAAVDFWNTLYTRGPGGFLDEAVVLGYEPQAQYASKCHLCADIRRFFFDKSRYLPIICPNECYGRQGV